MKHFLFTSIILLFTTSLYLVNAQDIIVAKDGDSLHCKIASSDKDYLYFGYQQNGKVKNTLIPRSEVSFYARNYYDEPEINEKFVRGIRLQPELIFNVAGGYSRLKAELAPGIDPAFYDYYDDLKTGLHVSAGITYYFEGKFGVGIQYSRYFSSATFDRYISVQDSAGNTRIGMLSESVTVQFAGPSYSYMIRTSSDKFRLAFHLAVGYMHYNNDATIVDDYVFSGNTLGVMSRVDGDIIISPGLSLGIGISSVNGVISNMYVDNGEIVEKIEFDEGVAGEGIGRYDLLVGVKWHM